MASETELRHRTVGQPLVRLQDRHELVLALPDPAPTRFYAFLIKTNNSMFLPLSLISRLLDRGC